MSERGAGPLGAQGPWHSAMVPSPWPKDGPKLVQKNFQLYTTSPPFVEEIKTQKQLPPRTRVSK